VKPLPALVVSLLLLLRAAPLSAEDVVVEGARWRLTSAGPRAEAEEWSRMLEAAWPQYAEFFGKAPTLAKDEKLAVAVFETLPAMEAAIKAAGGTPPGAGEGGFYDPASKTSYAFRQPSVWYTRALLLHECAHQFHWRAKGLSGSAPFWFGEGAAEHLSRHTWDGSRLRLGVVPPLSLENYAGRALEALKSPTFDFEKVFTGAGDVDRPVVMHLIRYLVHGENGRLRPKFDDLAPKAERGTKFDAASFAKWFGSAKKFVPAWRAWLETALEPWEVLTVEWDARDSDALRGTSPNCFALCRRRAETKRLAAKLRPIGTGAWKAGLLLRYGGPEDYDVALILDGAKVRIDRRKDGKWEPGRERDAPHVEGGGWRIEGVRDGDVVKCVVNGTDCGEIEAPPGSMGFALDSSTAEFTEIEAR
jgi:hypothetical protein